MSTALLCSSRLRWWDEYWICFLWDSEKLYLYFILLFWAFIWSILSSSANLSSISCLQRKNAFPNLSGLKHKETRFSNSDTCIAHPLLFPSPLVPSCTVRPIHFPPWKKSHFKMEAHYKWDFFHKERWCLHSQNQIDLINQQIKSILEKIKQGSRSARWRPQSMT